MKLKTYKVEIKLSLQQKIKINKTIGTCRFIYNFFVAHNIENYKKGNKFINGFTFSKWLNNEFLPFNKSYNWLKEVSSKAVKQSIMNGQKAFTKFFKKQSKFPKFKRKSRQDVKCYFIGNSNWFVNRHLMKVPTLGKIRFKEFGYVPINANVSSVTISKKANRYFASVLCKVEEDLTINCNYTNAIGVDLGLKDFAIISNGKVFKNINKTVKIKKIEKRLRRVQKAFSRKLINKKLMKGESNKNLEKNRLNLQKLYFKLSNIRDGYIKHTVNTLVRTKPEYIAIEDLNISGMMKNRHLSKAIQKQNFYKFRLFLISQCNKLGIEVRIIDRFYPSSKLCRGCGTIKKDLKLSDRIYRCECGNKIDRDVQASLNIRDCEIYTIAS